MNLSSMISDVQRALAVTADGKAGPETWTAIHAKLCPRLAASMPVMLTDSRSEQCIMTLHERVRPMGRALINLARDQGISIKIISGTRTYDEQNYLYTQGRSNPGDVVTNARGGYSNHNFGIAFDIGIFDAMGGYVPESPAYKAVAALGQGLGLEWGGNWQTITDEPHFQLRPQWAGEMSESQMLAELRRRKDAGKDAFAV